VSSAHAVSSCVGLDTRRRANVRRLTTGDEKFSSIFLRAATRESSSNSRDAETAADARRRTIEFFRENL